MTLLVKPRVEGFRGQ